MREVIASFVAAFGSSDDAVQKAAAFLKAEKAALEAAARAVATALNLELVVRGAGIELNLAFTNPRQVCRCPDHAGSEMGEDGLPILEHLDVLMVCNGHGDEWSMIPDGWEGDDDPSTQYPSPWRAAVLEELAAAIRGQFPREAAYLLQQVPFTQGVKA